ncbi:MAG: extracellular solute-binding protein [Methyloligellaceae bacterium]
MRFIKLTIVNSLISLIAVTAIYISSAQAEQVKHHALSLIGKPKYPADFKHFDYVNPDAPKGGEVKTWALRTYETLNPFPATKGIPAAGIASGALLYEPLMRTSTEEPSTAYGLIAEWASYPEDFSSVTFKLRDEAKFHDGKQITVDDVIFSFESFVKVNVQAAHYYENVKEVKKTGDREVTFYFNTKNNRELPLIVSELRIVPKHFWTGKDKDGKPRNIAEATLELPLGSGPYKVQKAIRGKTISFRRVDNYWGKDLPINKGFYNFNEITFDYFLDTNVALEAFKAGKLDYFDVNSSKLWATAFNFPAMKQGLVKKVVVPQKSVGSMQAFVLNTRREQFQDPKVRQALNLVYNFEWANKNLFYSQYSRLNSYFDNTEMAAKGLPQGAELAILNEFKDKIPPEVFTKEYKSPVNKTSSDFRKNARQAFKLLKEAGWVVTNGKLVNKKTGKPFQIEFLLVSEAFSRVVIPYAQDLKRLGIDAKIRVVDGPQYKRRVDGFEYDAIVSTFGQSFSPGNEQRFYWGSASADQNGSRNYIGIKSPVIDKIIDKIIFAKNREELVTTVRAMDRILLWSHYVIPHWYAAYERISYWDKFGYPQALNILPPECLNKCMQDAIKKNGKIYTLDSNILGTWWYTKKDTKKQ